MRLQNDRNAIRIEIYSLFGRAEIYEKERRKRMTECKREITKEIHDNAGGDGKPLRKWKDVFTKAEKEAQDADYD